MKLNFTQLAICALVFGLFSCGNNSSVSQVEQASNSFSLELIDSVQIDFLGDMKLIDYDAQHEKYLISDNSGRNYLEVDDQGKVLNQNELRTDGLNAVSSVSGIGYLDGDVAVLTQTDGYYKFRDATKIGEITIPYPYLSVIFQTKLGIFSEGNRIYYQKPWPQTIDLSMNNWDLYRQLYDLPIIESMDVKSGDTLAAVRLPRSSAFLDGRVHGFLLPTYSRFDDLLLLSIQIRPEIYVYKKEGIGFNYLKTVSIEIPDWVSYDPVEKENSERIYEGMRNKQIGVVHSLLKVDNYYLAVYSKGIPEEKMPEAESDHSIAGLQKRKANPFFAAVFDTEFNQIATDIAFPIASNYPTVVNNSGEIVLSKISGISDTEDEGVILYKLKLKPD